jgi:hypothetical protein
MFMYMCIEYVPQMKISGLNTHLPHLHRGVPRPPRLHAPRRAARWLASTLDRRCCRVLQYCVAVCCCCSVLLLQCVAVCCSVLQCVAVCYSERLACGHSWPPLRQCVAVRCSALHSVVVCCSALQVSMCVDFWPLLLQCVAECCVCMLV